MDVRCERCRAQYVFDDDQVTPAGLTVQCTNCGHVFKVKKKELVVTVPVRPDELEGAPIPATAAAPRPHGAPDDRTRGDAEWRIRQANGNVLTFRELTTLQKWIVEEKVSRDDQISLSGDQWKRLGEIAELAPFFQVVAQAARGKSQPTLSPLPSAGFPMFTPSPAGGYAPPPPPSGFPPPAFAAPSVGPGATQRGIPPPPGPFAPAAASRALDLGAAPPRSLAEPTARAGVRAGRVAAAAIVIAALAAGAYALVPRLLRPGALQRFWALAPGASPAAPTASAPPASQPAAPAPAAPAPVANGSTEATAPASAPAPAPAGLATVASAPSAVPPAAAVPAAPAASAPAGPAPSSTRTAVAGAAEPAPEAAGAAKPRPTGPRGLLAQAQRLREKGDAARALDLYGRAVDADPENAAALAGRGLCYLDLSQYAPAEASFQAALAVDPEHPDALLGLAEAYRWQGRKAEAIKYYERYLAAHADGEDAAAARNAISQLKE
jgi:predicted Zn finger-like uncharacterized protein